MTDSQTTELLREGLTEHGTEWRSGLEGVTFVGDWCFVEYDNGKLAATCEPVLTPEQAIAAITERECLERAAKSDWLGQHFYAIMAENRELQAKLDELNTRACERHAYEQRITGDGSDWGEIMCSAFDALMAAACEACTLDELERFEAHIMKEVGE